MTDEKPVITASEAARIAGVAYTSIMRAILSGRLKAEKYASLWVVDPESLTKYAAEVQAWKAKRRP